jgi:hypothetical protein
MRKDSESATFEYDNEWLKNPAKFSLEPALQLGPGPFHTPADTPMFGAIGDSAPDRWGRALMRRMERRRADAAGTAPRTLREIDFLLLVDDQARMGALRFAEQEGGPFLREEGVKRIPPLVELPKLLAAAEHLFEDKDSDEDLKLLFAPGSSLGGARPKASVVEKDGHLAIAKFPRKGDEINNVVWEGITCAIMVFYTTVPMAGACHRLTISTQRRPISSRAYSAPRSTRWITPHRSPWPWPSRGILSWTTRRRARLPHRSARPSRPGATKRQGAESEKTKSIAWRRRLSMTT